MQQNSRKKCWGCPLFTECQSGGGTLLHADGALGANTKRSWANDRHGGPPPIISINNAGSNLTMTRQPTSGNIGIWELRAKTGWGWV